MVWANTLKVGCGSATCSGQFILVCDYSPPGNYIGETPFPVANCQSCGVNTAAPPITTAPPDTTANQVQTSQPHVTTANQVQTSQPHLTTANQVQTSQPHVTTANQVQTSQHVSSQANPSQVAASSSTSFPGIIIKIVLPANISNFNVTEFDIALAAFLKLASNSVILQSIVQTPSTITITLLILDPDGTVLAIIQQFIHLVQNNDPSVAQALGTPVLSVTVANTQSGASIISFQFLLWIGLMALLFA